MIFCVEDDKSIRDLMIYTLGVAGFEAMGFADSAEFYKELKQNVPELIMLDIMLPGQDGLSILRELKSHRSTEDIPVIMATAKGTEFDKVTGLDSGADDYLTKPFGMMEMLSRIKAVLRRTNKTESNILKNGPVLLNTDEHTVTVNGKAVQLTLKEFELLEIFMKNIGKAFSRETLLIKVWDTDFIGETRTVDVHIGTLRTKLGIEKGCIETVRGIGYKMEDMND